ncbi:MAG: ARMT1-like domain-containing protein [Methanotrichaceae archaeon]|nr:ARMT1-like domain-containing protein [Methanotrichaceae archaeon]
MRMASDCYSCILDRAKFGSDLVFTNDKDKLKVLEELLSFMACHKGDVPALVGTEREKIIQKYSGNPDPYKALKNDSNRLARELMPIAQQFYEKSENKLEALIRIAAASNSMEFGVKGHDFDNSTFGTTFASTLGENFEGDLTEVERRLNKFDNIFYITDNSGEIIFDLFVIEKLKGMKKTVVIGAKSEPVLNDITAQEVQGMTEGKIVPTSPIVGISLDSISLEALDLLSNPKWLVISKGMGNFETMSEFDSRFKGKLIYVLRAKCQPVADALGVRKGTLVVKSI